MTSLNPAATPFPKSQLQYTKHHTHTASDSSESSFGFAPPSTHSTTSSNNKIPVYKFGEGWKSSTNMAGVEVKEGKVMPTRVRSPSLPNLAAYNQMDQLNSSFGNLDVNLEAHHDYVAPTPQNPKSNYESYYSTPIFEPFDDIPSIHPNLTFHLNHRQSAPALVTLPRGPGILKQSVRFEALDEEEAMCEGDRFIAEGGLEFGVRGHTGVKSMLTLPFAGEGKNVYIANLAELEPHMTRARLEDIASHFGVVRWVKVESAALRGGEQFFGVPEKYGLVLFNAPEEAARFMGYLKGYGIGCEYGREDFQTKFKACEDQDSANLYIQGMPTTTTKDDLRDLLYHHGGITISEKLLVDDYGNRRGPILARVQSRPQADSIIAALNGKLHPVTESLLTIRIADSDPQKELKRKASVLAGLPPHLPQAGLGKRHASMPAIRHTLPNAASEALREIELCESRARQLRATLGHASNPAYDYPATPALSPRGRYVSDGYESPITPSTGRSFGFYDTAHDYHSPSFYRGGDRLHHTRSSPDMTAKYDTAPALLWPDHV